MYVIWFGCFLLTVGFAKRCDLAAAGFCVNSVVTVRLVTGCYCCFSL